MQRLESRGFGGIRLAREIGIAAHALVDRMRLRQFALRHEVACLLQQRRCLLAHRLLVRVELFGLGGANGLAQRIELVAFAARGRQRRERCGRLLHVACCEHGFDARALEPDPLRFRVARPPHDAGADERDGRGRCRRDPHRARARRGTKRLDLLLDVLAVAVEAQCELEQFDLLAAVALLLELAGGAQHHFDCRVAFLLLRERARLADHDLRRVVVELPRLLDDREQPFHVAVREQAVEQVQRDLFDLGRAGAKMREHRRAQEADRREIARRQCLRLLRELQCRLRVFLQLC